MKAYSESLPTTPTTTDSFKYLGSSSIALQWPSTHSCLPLSSGKTTNHHIRYLYNNFLQQINCPWRRTTKKWLHSAVLRAAVMECMEQMYFSTIRKHQSFRKYSLTQGLMECASPTDKFSAFSNLFCASGSWVLWSPSWFLRFGWCPSVGHDGRKPCGGKRNGQIFIPHSTSGLTVGVPQFFDGSAALSRPWNMNTLSHIQ